MQRVTKLAASGQYKPAIGTAKRIIKGLEWLGESNTPIYFTNLQILAQLYGFSRDFARGETIHRKVLAWRQKRLGRNHPSVAESLTALSDIHIELEKYDLAKRGLLEAMAIRQAKLPPTDPNYGLTYVKLGRLAYRKSRTKEAARHFRTALDLFETHLPPNHPYIPLALNNLAEVHKEWADYDSAEAMLKRSLALNERNHKNKPLIYAPNLNNLADLYRLRGDYDRAEKLQRRELEILEEAFGSNDPSLAKTLNNLALIMDNQERPKAAIPLLRRALAIARNAKPVNQRFVATIVNNLANSLLSAAQYLEAEQLFQRSIVMREKQLGPNHLSVAVVLSNLATLYENQNHYDKALPLARRALRIRQRALPSDHPTVALSLNNLGIMLDKTERSQEAQRMHEQALAIRLRALNPNHPDLAISYNNLGGTALDQRRFGDAYRYFEQANAIWLHRIRQRGANQAEPDRELKRYNGSFLGLAWAAYEVARNAAADRYAELRDQAFMAVQWAQGTRSAVALAKYAARVALGTGPLSDLARQRQDLANRIAALDRVRLQATVGDNKASSQKARRANIKHIVTQLRAAQGKLENLDRRLDQRFPEYASLTRPRPLSLATAQQNLTTDEVLYVIAPTRGGSFVWLVTKTAIIWRKIALSNRDLERDVTALRCGLDATQWVGEAALKCLELVKPGTPRKDLLLPYDLRRAHKLYTLLFAPFEDQIAGRELLLVANGGLSRLPVQALVTDPPSKYGNNAAAYQAAAWYAYKQAIAILPAVSSLAALRRTKRNTSASPSAGFLGIANPLLNGDPASRPSDAFRARLARQATNCATAHRATSRIDQRTLNLTSLRAVTSSLADVSLLRAQSPLPETADEVCQVGALFDKTHSRIILGRDAAEAKINSLNRQSELSKYGIIHFATHGALAGELSRGMEPGLILTPPKQASREDDGYLSVSEIAELRLNADWVILSACNTAGGDEDSPEALSGLARAFFYAGARSLLVSHWAVDSHATVELITGALKATRGSRRISKAEALRRSMVALMKGGQPHLAHPTYWAPFILAGAR